MLHHHLPRIPQYHSRKPPPLQPLHRPTHFLPRLARTELRIERLFQYPPQQDVRVGIQEGRIGASECAEDAEGGGEEEGRRGEAGD